MLTHEATYQNLNKIERKLLVTDRNYTNFEINQAEGKSEDSVNHFFVGCPNFVWTAKEGLFVALIRVWCCRTDGWETNVLLEDEICSKNKQGTND